MPANTKKRWTRERFLNNRNHLTETSPNVPGASRNMPELSPDVPGLSRKVPGTSRNVPGLSPKEFEASV